MHIYRDCQYSAFLVTYAELHKSTSIVINMSEMLQSAHNDGAFPALPSFVALLDRQSSSDANLSCESLSDAS